MANKIHAAHILVPTQEEANQIKAELDDGYNFEAIAKHKSKCPSGEKGGDLGWFGRGQMVKEFEQTAFALQKGEISEPVKTQFGWHIIKLLEAT